MYSADGTAEGAADAGKRVSLAAGSCTKPFPRLTQSKERIVENQFSNRSRCLEQQMVTPSFHKKVQATLQLNGQEMTPSKHKTRDKGDAITLGD